MKSFWTWVGGWWFVAYTVIGSGVGVFLLRLTLLAGVGWGCICGVGWGIYRIRRG